MKLGSVSRSRSVCVREWVSECDDAETRDYFEESLGRHKIRLWLQLGPIIHIAIESRLNTKINIIQRLVETDEIRITGALARAAGAMMRGSNRIPFNLSQVKYETWLEHFHEHSHRIHHRAKWWQLMLEKSLCLPYPCVFVYAILQLKMTPTTTTLMMVMMMMCNIK